MLVIAVLACEADLTIGAAAIGLALRNRSLPITVLATAGASIGFALAVFGLWALWFVGPRCVVGGAGCEVPASSLAYLGSGAAVQWLWMLAIALTARFAKNRDLAHVSG
jgi:hypothetical protein